MMALQPNSLPGKVEVGDTVRTLNRRRAVEGVVLRIRRKKGKEYGSGRGAPYLGGPEERFEEKLEDLAIVSKAEKQEGSDSHG